MNPDAILARQIALTYRQFPLLAAVSTATALLFAAAVADSVGRESAALWFGVATLVMALRIVFYLQFNAASTQENRARRWRRHLFAGAVLSGLVWGAAALFCLATDDANERIFVVVLAVTTVTTGASWHAAVPRASAAYVVGAVAPFAVVMLAQPGQSHLFLAVGSMLLMLVLLAIARRSGDLIQEWCVQAVRNDSLARSLESTRSHLVAEVQQRQEADAHRDKYGRKLDLLIRQTPLATIEWGEDSLVTEWNPAAEVLFGHRRTEVVGRHAALDLIFSEPGRERALQQWRRLSGKREGFQIVTENVARDGRVLTCSWAVAPLLDADGRWIGTIAQAQDMTATNAAFRAVEESRRQLEEAQQLAHIGHWEWDYANKRAAFSREALRLFGKAEGWNPSPEELAKLVADGGGGDVIERVRQACAEQLQEFAVEHHIGDGEASRDLHTRVRIEYGADGAASRLIAAMQDVTELHEYQQKLHSLAFFDTLTGLPNRALFNDRMRQAIADAAWHKDLMGLMVLDLDRFKAINDTLGHGSGDQLLCEAARRLVDCVRGYDTVARLGGDEFAILLPQIRNGADLGNIARKIIDAFVDPFRLEGKDLFVTCSIGIGLYPSDGDDSAELLRYADLAMYDAKSKGRNNFQFYSTDLTARSAERLALDAQLRLAERNGELELHYQPQVDLASGRLIGVEALLRWNHPERGLVMPDKFIGIAEDTGLIVGIGEWVLRTACHAARRWNERRQHGFVKVAVNLSPRQFRMNDLVGTIRAVLKDTGCRAEWLECEITENLLLGDCDDVRATLFEMNAMGISLAIDDFGTGYSSLGYLNRYPVGSIKIDRSFVRNVMTSRNSAELVKAIISMARSLRLETVAEGVESGDQRDFLLSCGCGTGQGWLYGKAMPQVQLEAMLRTLDAAESGTPKRRLAADEACADGAMP
jgi:diguanylate cyclase (GGDEF)-like protein/PAS domain S-box-containing protein